MSPYLKMYYEFTPIIDIASHMGISKKYCAAILAQERRDLGLDIRGSQLRKNLLEFIADKDLVLELRSAGLSYSDIADKWDVQTKKVREHVEEWTGTKETTIRLCDLADCWKDLSDETIIRVNGEPKFKLIKI